MIQSQFNVVIPSPSFLRTKLSIIASSPSRTLHHLQNLHTPIRSLKTSLPNPPIYLHTYAPIFSPSKSQSTYSKERNPSPPHPQSPCVISNPLRTKEIIVRSTNSQSHSKLPYTRPSISTSRIENHTPPYYTPTTRQSPPLPNPIPSPFPPSPLHPITPLQ